MIDIGTEMIVASVITLMPPFAGSAREEDTFPLWEIYTAKPRSFRRP